MPIYDEDYEDEYETPRRRNRPRVVYVKQKQSGMALASGFINFLADKTLEAATASTVTLTTSQLQGVVNANAAQRKLTGLLAAFGSGGDDEGGLSGALPLLLLSGGI